MLSVLLVSIVGTVTTSGDFELCEKARGCRKKWEVVARVKKGFLKISQFLQNFLEHSPCNNNVTFVKV